MLTLETAICAVIDNPTDMETVALELMRQGIREPMPGTIAKVARDVGVKVAV